MAKELVTDELWAVVEPLLPPHKAKPGTRGRPPVPDRAVLTGILFILKTGIPWEWLPQEMGCGSGMTCWRRLRDWHEAGVWQRLHEALLARLEAAHLLDWDRASVDAVFVRAKGARPRRRESKADKPAADKPAVSSRSRGAKKGVCSSGRPSAGYPSEQAPHRRIEPHRRSAPQRRIESGG